MPRRVSYTCSNCRTKYGVDLASSLQSDSTRGFSRRILDCSRKPRKTMPLAWSWLNAKPHASKSFVKVLGEEIFFVFICISTFLEDCPNRCCSEKQMRRLSCSLGRPIWGGGSLLAIVAPTLLSYKLKSREKHHYLQPPMCNASSPL